MTRRKGTRPQHRPTVGSTRSRRRSRRKAASSARRSRQHLGQRADHRLILLNKPDGVLCQFSDAQGRPTLADYVDVPDVYPAGRLDKDSEGLVLLTNDGWLAHRITHPRHHLPKVYLVQVEGVPDEATLEALRRGVVISDKREGAGVRVRTAPAQVERLPEEPSLWPRFRPVRPYGEKSWLRIVLREGKKRQVRHMTAAVGHPTLRLVRVAIGPLTLGDLQPGQWRDATPEEFQALYTALHSWRR